VKEVGFVNYILLLLITLGTVFQSLARKEYNTKTGNCAFTFSAASVLFALLFFLFCIKGKFSITMESFWYAVGFAVAYMVTCVSLHYAIQTGPLSLTTLFSSYSLLIPTLYGLLKCNEKVSFVLLIGIVLLMVSIFFVNIEEEGEKRITVKWVFYALLTFLGNGSCSVLQKMQQSASGGLYGNEFMVVALTVSLIGMSVFALIVEGENIRENLKKGIVEYAVCGLSNAVANFLVLFLVTRLPASVMFPVISAGGIVITTLLSIFRYHEKLSVFQHIGILLGAGSVIFLNLT